MGGGGDVDGGVVEADHAAAVAVALGGFEDDFAEIDGEDAGPEPIEAVVLPAEEGVVDQQAEVERAQSAVAGEGGIEKEDRARDDRRHEDERGAGGDGVVALDQPAEDKEESAIGDEVGPAEVDEVAGPETPPLAGGDRGAVVDEDVAPGGVELDDEGDGAEGEEAPREFVAGEEPAEGCGQEGVQGWGERDVVRWWLVRLLYAFSRMLLARSASSPFSLRILAAIPSTDSRSAGWCGLLGSEVADAKR